MAEKSSQSARPCGSEVLRGLLAEQRLDGVLRRPPLIARLVKLVNVGEEEVVGRIGIGSLAAPLRRDERQIVEDPVGGEVSLQPLVHDHVRRDDQEVGGQLRARHPLLVEPRPDDGHCHHPGLARAGGHLEGEAAQVFGREVLYALGVQLRHVATQLPPTVHRGLERDVFGEEVLFEDRRVGLDQLLRVALATDLDQPHQCLDRLALAKVVTEWHAETCDLVVLVEPVLEQPPRDL